MNDPRKNPAWKQQRYEEKHLLLLGAILDALLEQVPPVAVEPPQSDARLEMLGIKRTRTKKDS